MSSPILTINKEVLVKEAISIMRKEGIRRLVVVTDKNKFEETNLSLPTDEKGKTTDTRGFNINVNYWRII